MENIRLNTLGYTELVKMVDKCFEYANKNKDRETVTQMAEELNVGKDTLRRLLRGETHIAIRKRLGHMPIRYRIDGMRKVNLLSPCDMSMVVRIVNGAFDLKEALESNPYYGEGSVRCQWYDEVILSFWNLKKIKRKICEENEDAV